MQFEEIEKQLDLISKVIKIALQLSVGIGILIILVYSGKVGYHPSGLAAGDGLLFIAIALSFGFSYSIVVFFLFCTAIMLTPFWRVVQTVVVYIYKLWLKIKRQAQEADTLEFPPLTSDHLGVVVIGIIGLILVIHSYFKDVDLFIYWAGLFCSTDGAFLPFSTKLS